MIVVALVLLAIGAVDLARQFLSRPVLRALVLLGILLAAGVAAGVLGGWNGWVLAVPLSGIAWILLLPGRGRAPCAGWPAVLLAVAATTAVWLDESAAPSGALAHGLLVAGVALFLIESGNVVVRVALDAGRPIETARDEAPDAAAPVSARRSRRAWGLRRGGDDAERAPVARPALKGGRLIGPLERVLIVALGLGGAFTLIAALVAGKGIVRFPEISRDSADGDRAEYFLVGSMVSWTIALVAAWLLWAAGVPELLITG